MRRFTLLLVLMTAVTAVLALFTLFTPTAQADEVGGIIDTDTTWTLAGSPYVMTDTVTIIPGVTLTIEAGVEVRAGLNTAVEVHGTLLALGTANQLITFTSVSGAADWLGIFFATGGGFLHETIVEYGSFNIGVGHLLDPDVQVIIEDSVTQNSVGYGLAVDIGVLPQVILSNLTFSNNSLDRVRIYPFPNESFPEDTILTSQPGLEGYELHSSFNGSIIPEGITLTMEAGSSLMMPDDSYLSVDGHLDAQGTITQPITLTSANNPQPNAWDGIYVHDTGTINLEHSIVEYGVQGIDVLGSSDRAIYIKDSTVRQNGYGMYLEIVGLHRLQMDHVTFEDNVFNRIRLTWLGGGQELADNVTLTSQPGLEGYELENTSIDIPAGITLTLDAGVTIMSEDNISIYGHLQANGTISEPVTFTSADDPTPGAWGVMIAFESGSLQLVNSIIEYAIIGANSNADNLSEIQDTVFRQNEYPILTSPHNLHLLQLDNVSFENNVRDRVFIDTSYNNTIISDVFLKPQPGLEGYQVDGDSNLVIQSGATLTMAAGSTLMMNPAANPFRELLVHGRLQADGTAVAPVTFTSSEDNAPGQWQGIIVDGGEVSLAHAEVRYAATNLTVNSPTSTVTITSSRLISASVDSIVVNDGLLNAACSIIAGSGQNGVFVAASGTPSVTITTSEIRGNGVGISNSHSLPVDARFNFWGDPSGPGGIGPGSGDAVYGNVLYDPWLAELTCSPPIQPVPGWWVYLPIIQKP